MESLEEMLKPSAKVEATEKVETPPEAEAKVEAKEEPAKEEEKEEETPEREKMVPLKALQEERLKRRAIKTELEELKRKSSSENYSTSVPDLKPAAKSEDGEMDEKTKWLYHTTNVIHQIKPDAQKVLEVFDKAVEANHEIYEQCLRAPDPGMFAYEYGKSVLNQEKYGSTPDEAFKRGWAEAEKATKQKVFDEIKTKKDLGEKLPKNLASAGTSGSGSSKGEPGLTATKDLWG